MIRTFGICHNLCFCSGFHHRKAFNAPHTSCVSTIFQMTMASRLCLLVVAAWTGWAASQDTDYCKFTSEHTVCKFSGRGPRCGPRVRGSGVSSEDAAVIVALHNELRSKVARGEETRGDPGPQPSGANMRALVSTCYSIIIHVIPKKTFPDDPVASDTFLFNSLALTQYTENLLLNTLTLIHVTKQKMITNDPVASDTFIVTFNRLLNSCSAK